MRCMRFLLFVIILGGLLDSTASAGELSCKVSFSKTKQEIKSTIWRGKFELAGIIYSETKNEHAFRKTDIATILCGFLNSGDQKGYGRCQVGYAQNEGQKSKAADGTVKVSAKIFKTKEFYPAMAATGSLEEILKSESSADLVELDCIVALK